MSTKENSFEAKLPPPAPSLVSMKKRSESNLRTSIVLSKSSMAESLSNIRMQTYTKLYSNKIFPKTTISQGQSTIRLNENSEILREGTRETKVNLTSISSKQIKRKITNRAESLSQITPIQRVDNNEKKIKDGMYEIQTALSDKLELMRDLATYENNFSKSKDLSILLGRLRVLSASIPDTYDENNGIQTEEKVVYKKLTEGLNSLLNLETQHSPKLGHSQVEYESFDLKSIYQIQKFESVFQGIFNISCISSIINFRSDKWLEYIEITVQTPYGDFFNMNIRLAISNSYQNKKQVSAYAKKSILPHLYYIYYKNELKMNYDYRHSHTFYSLICRIRGWGVCSVELTENNEQQVHIQVSSIDDALEVPIYIITSKSSLFLETSDWLKRVIEKYLCYIPEMNGLYWHEVGDQGFIFFQKEMSSILMNDEYLKEELDILLFSELYTFEAKINNAVFVIEILGSTQHVKINVKYENETVDISSESKRFKLLTDLQSLNIRKGIETLRSSLELELFLRKVFPKAFLCKNKEN
ncbi:unnamed protein product [Blepharisma stoltei]|uniref:Uncharacterized protein n=1 Tax=Blepharisma stoltei TaxID=1481888 RepID=A0AAU9I8R7_9CILI|nr:unnamed protein product [Blepharisma stoltei]